MILGLLVKPQPATVTGMPGSSQQLPGLVRKDPAVQPQVRPASGSQGFLRGTDDHFQGSLCPGAKESP